MVGSLAGAAATGLADALAKLLIIKLEGNISPAVCPTLHGAALTALGDKDDGIRPIFVLYQLSEKIASYRVITVMTDLVRTAQLGYAT